MNRIEFNCTTGERKVIALTPKEEADALARTAAEAAKPAPPSEAMRLVELIKADPEALAAFKSELVR